jgi:hypothetical protein
MNNTASSRFGRHLKRVISRSAAAVAVLTPLVADAEIHQCKTSSGWVAQDKPCETAPAPVKAAPSPTSIAPAKPVARPPMGDPAYEQAREAKRRAAIDAWSKTAGRVLGEDIALHWRPRQLGQNLQHLGPAAPHRAHANRRRQHRTVVL